MLSYNQKRISEELLSKLEEAFRGPVVKPGIQRDDLMFKAGQKYVVDWIKQEIKK